MIVCAGESESFEFAHPIGIGMIDVAMNLTKLCMQSPPEFILFVGSAGSYGEKKIFDIIESNTATNIENSFFGGGSYTILDNVISTAEDVSRETFVNSSNYITTDAKRSKHYIAQNIHLENMEFFSVLKVAGKFGIRAGGIFIVTNYCNEDAHEDFTKNHKEAMAKLSEYILKK
ncbi:MAG: Purine nucleoside phosphorylase [uncultured Sulfurovum sp.]|uniref:Purine nucleoside phosphorylase n=1 Tax=uncultured Sulfurovum sp. TaxID=269237 RepID=A0A6S6SB61_9BACT|nr:MAG: Purine nucleoside phosphorylase [uncultured Sulfurovum sp.]